MKSPVGILLGVIFNLWINSGTVEIFIKFIWNEVIHPSLYQFICLIIISSSLFSSVSQSCLTLCNIWTAAYQASLSITNSQSLLKLMFIELWCHPTISYPVVPSSFCLQSFPALGSFSMSQFFTSGGQSIGVSASASVLPMNIQGWFPLELESPRDSPKSSPSSHFKSINSLVLSFLCGPTLPSIHDYWKNHNFD